MGLINSRKRSSPITPFFTSSFFTTFSPTKTTTSVHNNSHSFTVPFEIVKINPTSNRREVIIDFKTPATFYHLDKYYDNITGLTRKEEKHEIQKLSNVYENLKKLNS